MSFFIAGATLEFVKSSSDFCINSKHPDKKFKWRLSHCCLHVPVGYCAKVDPLGRELKFNRIMVSTHEISLGTKNFIIHNLFPTQGELHSFNPSASLKMEQVHISFQKFLKDCGLHFLTERPYMEIKVSRNWTHKKFTYIWLISDLDPLVFRRSFQQTQLTNTSYSIPEPVPSPGQSRKRRRTEELKDQRTEKEDYFAPDSIFVETMSVTCNHERITSLGQNPASLLQDAEG